jgi:putative acetyltransferase
VNATLRDGTAGDHPAMVELWVAAWNAAMPAIDFEERRAWFASHLAALEARGVLTRVAVDRQGSLLGFVTVDPADGYVDQLAVRPSAQRRRLATRLLAEAGRISPDRLTLEVNQANTSALLFYQSRGFGVRQEGVNPRSGLPVWLMERRAADAVPIGQAQTSEGGVPC